jgi:lysophospholipase L1-like esterase
MNPLRFLAALVFTASLSGADNWMVDPAAARAIRAEGLRNSPAAFTPVTDDPALPRVLLIGDSISIGYTPVVRQLLAGTANVHRIPDNGGATVLGLAMIDEWLGDGRWDVIHFNFGLHDVTLDDTGRVRTPPAEYAENLRRIVARLRRTGARLLFATSTPVPGETKHPSRRESDALEVNRQARRVMADAGVPVVDLYAVVQPRLGEWQIPANVHFKEAGYEVLGREVAQAIKAALPPH